MGPNGRSLLYSSYAIGLTKAWVMLWVGALLHGTYASTRRQWNKLHSFFWELKACTNKCVPVGTGANLITVWLLLWAC